MPIKPRVEWETAWQWKEKERSGMWREHTVPYGKSRGNETENKTGKSEGVATGMLQGEGEILRQWKDWATGEDRR